MATILLKTEPGEYSFEDLVRERTTVWRGVSAAPALKAMREARKGDAALMYHTGAERAVVGTATLTSDPYPDPEADDPRLVVFDIKAGKPLAKPVSLAAMKADPRFKDFVLLRQGRLSVVPVPPSLAKLILALGGSA